ncbi:hypothetical protein MTR67_007200 [Solanum verrucosum]|uniref:Gag-pol polyprotein n=1 Tax=Solanum verrucosum TaxID=315347 RepID=A0AAF0Q2W0_SOLVR|nr:hypothetical protein MTR67_007200 [Solanum verrucosum]
MALRVVEYWTGRMKDMPPRIANARRNVELEVPQVPVDPLADSSYNGQANREEICLVNPNMGMAAIRVRDFTRMNTLEFYKSKVDEDPKEFVDKVYKIVKIMGVSQVEKVELATYQLKGVAQV